MLLLKSHVCFVGFVVGADLVLWETDQTTLLCQSLKDRLTDPPYGVGDKFETLGLIKTLGGLDQTEIALVDQIAE